MRKTIRVAPILLAAAALLATAVAPPAQAVVDGADYVVWRFLAPGPRGVGLIHDGTSNTVMLSESVGLKPNTGYRYVGSSARCGGTHQPANVVWQRDFQSNGKGGAFTDTTFDDEALTSDLRSIRLFQGSAQVDCAKPLQYRSGGGDGAPIDSIAMLSPYDTRLMVFLDLGSGNDRLTAAGHGFIRSHGYLLVGASVSCPLQPTATSIVFQKMGQTNASGVLWRHDTGSDLAGEPPKSIQLFSPSGRVACVTPTQLNAIR